MALWASCEIVSMGDPKNILFTTQLRFTALRSVILDGYTAVTKVLHCNEFRYTCRVSNRIVRIARCGQWPDANAPKGHVPRAVTRTAAAPTQ